MICASARFVSAVTLLPARAGQTAGFGHSSWEGVVGRRGSRAGVRRPALVRARSAGARALLGASVVCALVAGVPGTAAAVPPPPPNPSDAEIERETPSLRGCLAGRRP
ncbi:hypothetical protein GS506_24265, partial [Rhodococcus hoagii]|nr:hypothetical protein [Prescottella equi]